jgi:hypothetical protein
LRGAIALPDNAAHRREINQVKAVVAEAGVTVFWGRRETPRPGG